MNFRARKGDVHETPSRLKELEANERFIQRRSAEIVRREGARELANALKKETWFRLMQSASDPMYRRLSAGIFMATLLIETAPVSGQEKSDG